jgi:copper transport protein
MWRRAAAAALLAVAWLLLTGPSAGAHAVLRGSDPAAGASIAKAPAAVTLRFTEAPDPALSVVRVFDTAGRVVSSGAAGGAGDSLALRVPLAAPGPGTYTVAWRTVSKVDGHVSQGAFAFGVGLAGGRTAGGQTAGGQTAGKGVVPAPVSSPTGAGATGTSPLAVAARWGFYWGMALLVGAAATGLLVFGRRLPARATPLLCAALVLAAGGLAASAVATAREAGVPVSRLLASATGHWLEARAAALLLAAVAAAGVALATRHATSHATSSSATGRTTAQRAGPPAPDTQDQQEPPWRACPPAWLLALGVAASGGLLIHALAGHAAAPSSLRWLNLASQWLHLLAVAIWIGGLAWLVAGIAGAPRPALARAARRFSALAAWSLAAVALTGVQRAAAEVGGWSGLLGTAFGRALDVKLGLFAALVLLGGVNHFRVVPSLAGWSAAGSPARLRRTGRGELVVASGVLLAAAVLSQLPPGTDAAPIGPMGPMGPAAPRPPASVETSGADYATTLRVTLQVSPGVAGPNRFVATVADYDSGATVPADKVSLTAALPARPEVAPAQLDLTRAPDGRWSGQGQLLTIAGTWSLTALIERSSGGVTVPMDLRIAATPPS